MSSAIKPSHVQSGTLEKVRAGIKSKSIHLDYQPSNKDAHLIKQEKNKDNDNMERETTHGEEMIGDAPKTKRNLWWLNKKRRRKRSRLTYVREKCPKNEDGNEGKVVYILITEGQLLTSISYSLIFINTVAVSDELYLSEEDIDDPVLLEEYLDYADRPKRGRICELNDFVMRLEDEEVLAMADEQDPDWDESMEGKKVKPQVKPKRKGFGRPRKGNICC